MKLLGLDLLRWGPFADLNLDFSSPARALHIVVGSNEAGKSTTLRAITGLFYGIPANTSDDHRHKPDELRLGGRIAAEDGSELLFLRRKGKKGHTLKTPQGDAMDEERLRKFLGNIEENQFKMMFGLSHERLVEGGHALVEGKGDLGESLYGAGLGQAGVSVLLRKLGQKADEIFTPQARTRKLNQAINKFKAAKETQKEASHSMRQWDEQKKQRDMLDTSRQSLATQIDQLAREERRLLRVKRALRPIAERADVLHALEQHKDDVVLPDSAAEDRRAAEKVIREAGPRQEQLAIEIADLETLIEKLVIPEKLLEQETSVKQLREDLGSYRKAQHEAGQLQNALEGLEEGVRTSCKRLERDADAVLTGKDPGLTLSVALDKRVKGLIKQRLELDARLREATKSLQTAEVHWTQEKLRGESLPVPVSIDNLTLALEAARREGDLDKRIRDRAKEAEKLGQKVRNSYAAHEHYGFTFEKIGQLPIPPRGTLERLENEWKQNEDEIRVLDRAIDERKNNILKLAADIGVATRGGDVPTMNDLEAARAARTNAWVVLRRSLLGAGATDTPDNVAAFRAPSVMQHFEALSDYEAAVRRADEIADRLFREADRVARISELSSRKEALESEKTEFEERKSAMAVQKQDLTSRWEDVWKPSGIKALGPAEMKDFLGTYERLAEEVLRYRDLEAVVSADKNIAANHSRVLASLLTDASPADGLAPLIERATAACDREARTKNNRDAHVRDLERSAADVEDKRRAVEREQADSSHWATLWEKALVEMALPLDTTTGQVEDMLALLADLGKRAQDIQDKRRRLSNIERDAESFRQRTMEIVGRLDEHHADLTVEVLAASLVDRFHAAQQDDVKRKALSKQLDDKRRELADVGLRRKAAESEITSLCAAARVSSVADLPQAEERSKQIRGYRQKLGTLEKQLFDLGEGLTLEALVAECEGLSIDDVTARLSSISEKMAALAEAKGKADQDLGAAIQRLALVDGSARAAEAAEDAEQHLATMATLVEEYARAKLAHRLLDDEIKRHREKNQGPIIRRASELFEKLTLGSFIGIRGDNEGDEDKPILECVRPGGMFVRVEGLSDGTRDQLFLALRIASLERYFENNEPIPFILDDILVNFDDARSRASLVVLGELAQKTQVLFFTHHARVAELANEVITPDELRVHDLNVLGHKARSRITE